MSTSGSTQISTQRVRPSNDPGWEYGQPMPENRQYIKCDLCGIITKGGIKRHKQHLVGGFKDTKACQKATKEIREEIEKYMKSYCDKKEEKRRLHEFSIRNVNIYRDQDEQQNDEYEELSLTSSSVSKSSILPKGPKHKGSLDSMYPPNPDNMIQKPIDNKHRRKARDTCCEYIADFFYQNSISFHAVETPSYMRMVQAIGQYGEGLIAPTFHEIRVPLLKKKVLSIEQWVESFKTHWENYGCSIMTDWWTDGVGRTLINFLVNCPKGTIFLKSLDGSEYIKDAKLIHKMINDVIDEVGEKNVVQVSFSF